MNRIRVWIKKHKICTASICIILILLISALCVSPFVAIHIDDFRNMGCSSVVFDKRQMNGVDRIVVKTKNGETTIRDKALIRRMVKETMTATSIGYKVPYGDNEWRLYKGDTLIRRMRQSSGRVQGDSGGFSGGRRSPGLGKEHRCRGGGNLRRAAKRYRTGFGGRRGTAMPPLKGS